MPRATRIFFEREIDPQSLPVETELPAGECHHIRDVLRLQVGSALQVIDATGREFAAEICHLDRKGVKARLSRMVQEFSDPRIKTLILQAPPRATKVAALLPALGELGATFWQPVLTERTVLRLDFKNSSSWERHVKRWQRIAQESAKQSRRVMPMKILPPLDFAQAVELISQVQLGLFLDLPDKSEPFSPEAFSQSLRAKGQSLLSSDKSPGERTLAVLIGPEGGFSPQEKNRALQAGWLPFCLGPSILRCETAALAAMAVIQFVLNYESHF